MDTRSQSKAVFSYSLNPRIFGDFLLLILVGLGNLYFGYVRTHPEYLLLAVGLALFDVYRLWKMPLRKIQFYEDHLEVSGWKVHQKASYDHVEDLSRVRRVLGDFRSNSVVWFSIKDDPNEYMVPNRKIGKPKDELYNWLLQKNPKATKPT